MGVIIGASLAEGTIAAETARKQSRAADKRQKELTNLFDPLHSSLLNLGSALFGGGSLSDLEGGSREIFDFLMNPLPLNIGEKQAASFFFPRNEKQKAKFRALGGSPFDRLVGEAEGLVRENLFGATREGVETGFRTDVQPRIDEALHFLRTEANENILARAGGALSSTAVSNQLAQAAEDASFRIGALQVGADEAAAGRRLDILNRGTAERIFQLPLNIRTGANILKGNVATEFRNKEESVRPGGRLLQGLPTIVNAIRGTSGIVQGGFAPNNSAAILSALAPAIGLAAGQAGQLFADQRRQTNINNELDTLFQENPGGIFDSGDASLGNTTPQPLNNNGAAIDDGFSIFA